MKNILKFVLCLVFCISINLPAQEWNNRFTKYIYKRYLINNKRVLPSTYISTLTGTAILKKIKKIPKDALKKNKIPTVKVYYKKHSGHLIKVLNVDELFENMFSLYNNYINMTGSYLTKKGSSWKEFSTNHLLKVKFYNKYVCDLKIRKINQPENTYVLLKIRMKDMMITQVKFYNRNSLIYIIKNSYIRYGRYILPSIVKIISIKNGKYKSQAYIRFSNYLINAKIPANIHFK